MYFTWVTEYVESRCLDGAGFNVNVVQRTSSMQFHSVLIIHVNFVFKREMVFQTLQCIAMWRMFNVNVQCNFGQFSGTVAMYFADSMLTAFFSFVHWTMSLTYQLCHSVIHTLVIQKVLSSLWYFSICVSRRNQPDQAWSTSSTMKPTCRWCTDNCCCLNQLSGKLNSPQLSEKQPN